MFVETAARDTFELSDRDVAEMTPEQRRSYGIGIAVAGLLRARRAPGGRVHTQWGTKTAIGLGRTIIRLVEEN